MGPKSFFVDLFWLACFLGVDNTASTSLGVVAWLAPGREEETLKERDEDMGDEPGFQAVRTSK